LRARGEPNAACDEAATAVATTPSTPLAPVDEAAWTDACRWNSPRAVKVAVTLRLAHPTVQSGPVQAPSSREGGSRWTRGGEVTVRLREALLQLCCSNPFGGGRDGAGPVARGQAEGDVLDA